MVSGQPGVQPRFGPSNRRPESVKQASRLLLICAVFVAAVLLGRILELARHKTSKTTWATTPCDKLHWGAQQPIWPVSASPLGAAPSARIQYLARHKRDFSAREDHRRKEEEAAAARFFRKSQRPSSKTSQYENTVRLSRPKTRGRGSQEAGPPHTPHCEINRPVWHTHPNLKTVAVSPRLLQLSKPKPAQHDAPSSMEGVASVVCVSSRTARVSKRVAQLSLPRLKESKVCSDLGPPEEPIWSVSRAARKATASVRVEMLAEPKRLSKDYVPPREPEWRRKNAWSTRGNSSAKFESL